MSIRIEQYRALKSSRDFLRDLLDPAKTPRVPKNIRSRASHCLKHYPFLDDNGEPIFSRDNIDVPSGKVWHELVDAELALQRAFEEDAALNGADDERPSNEPCGTPIPEIFSAYINLGSARSDALMAEDSWENENWPDALMWIDEGIRQLSSARAKIERHVAKAERRG